MDHFGHQVKTTNSTMGVRPSSGAAITKLQSRHRSPETVSSEFIAVAGDGHTPHLVQKTRP